MLVRDICSLLALHTKKPRWRIFCLDLLVLSQYNPCDDTTGVSSPPPSSEATTLLAFSFLLYSFLITALVDCFLLSFYYYCRAVDLSIYPISKSPRIETGGVISGSMRRAPSLTCHKSGAGGDGYIILSNYLATIEILLELLE